MLITTMRLFDKIKAWFLSGPINGSMNNGDPDDSLDPFNPFPEPVLIEITDEIDLHSIPPRDVKRIVEEYLFQARQRRFQSVRIIHGKGIGVQREIVRNVLAKTEFVESFSDASAGGGGWGATVVRLSTTEEVE
jgi:dsDNA-specific endonuclease/ATPase MutS2